MLFSSYTNSQPGVEVTVGAARVGVAVGGRGVAVAGTRVSVGVSVGERVAVSVGLVVAVGIGVRSDVGVKLGLEEGPTVLVGVAVALGGDDTRGIRGQLQATVITAATAARASLVRLFQHNRNAPFPCGLPSCSDFRPFKRCTAYAAP
jgi:hypothetical protein